MKLFYYTVNVLLGKGDEERLYSLNLRSDSLSHVLKESRRIAPSWRFVESF